MGQLLSARDPAARERAPVRERPAAEVALAEPISIRPRRQRPSHRPSPEGATRAYT